MGSYKAAALIVGVLTLLSGCGLAVPDIKEPWDGVNGNREIAFQIKKRVYCDLKRGVQEANKRLSVVREDRPSRKRTALQFIPNSWGVQVSLNLQVDESTSLNPGVVFTTPLQDAVTSFGAGVAPVRSGQSRSVGVGGTISSAATRTDKYDPYYSVSRLMEADTSESICLPKNDPFLLNGETPSSSSPLIVSELGIEQWVRDAMFVNSLLPSDDPGSSRNSVTPDTVTLEVKFVIVTNGTVNPSWKLVNISANGGSAPLFGTGRTRTHSLILTLGPPKAETSNTHFASQVGLAVSNANRALLSP